MVKSSNHNLNSKFIHFSIFVLLRVFVVSDGRPTTHYVNLTYPETYTQNSTRPRSSVLRFDLQSKNEKINNTDYQAPKDPLQFLLEYETATLHGIRVEKVSKEVSYEKYVSVILADSEATIRLFGDRFSKNTMVRFTTESGTKGTDCDDVSATKTFHVSQNS
jgi:hypothetical protein